MSALCRTSLISFSAVDIERIPPVLCQVLCKIGQGSYRDLSELDRLEHGVDDQDTAFLIAKGPDLVRTKPDGMEQPFQRVGGADVLPHLTREVVEGQAALRLCSGRCPEPAEGTAIHVPAQRNDRLGIDHLVACAEGVQVGQSLRT